MNIFETKDFWEVRFVNSETNEEVQPCRFRNRRAARDLMRYLKSCPYFEDVHMYHGKETRINKHPVLTTYEKKR